MDPVRSNVHDFPPDLAFSNLHSLNVCYIECIPVNPRPGVEINVSLGSLLAAWLAGWWAGELAFGWLAGCTVEWPRRGGKFVLV